MAKEIVYGGAWVYGTGPVIKGDNEERGRRKLCASECLIEMTDLRVKEVMDRISVREIAQPRLQEDLDAGKAQWIETLDFGEAIV